MSNNSYGVVVEHSGVDFGIWHLFRGNDCALSLLDPRACPDALRIGDIVQAKYDGNDSRIVRWSPFSENVWSDGRRVVVRTIVSFTEEVTIRSGKFKDERTALSSVLVTSRDIGIVTAPFQWYNREFVEANENHLFVYVEFLKQSLYNAETDRYAAYYWTIAKYRISLPAVPSSNEVQHPEKFLEPEKLRKVPALVLARQGDSVFLWSYTLGIHTALLTDEHDTFSPGESIRIMVSRSPDRDFASHGCTYTVTSYRPMPSALPVVDNKITMSVTVSRSEPDPDNPRAPVKLWHDQWGLPIGYDEAARDWIRGEQSKFRATVEIEMKYTQDFEGRVVTIKVIPPAVVPRVSKIPASPLTAFTQFEDVDDLKKYIEKSNSASDSLDNMEKQEWRKDSKMEKDQKDSSGSRKGWCDGSQQGDGKSTEKCSDGGKMRLGPSTPRRTPVKGGDVKRGEAAENVPVRAYDDTVTQQHWEEWMMTRGWDIPAPPVQIVIPDGADGWEHMVSTNFGKLTAPPAPPVPAKALLCRQNFIRTALSLKRLECLITKVRFDASGKNALRIQLFVLHPHFAFVTHRCDDQYKRSVLKNKPEFTTVGNLVDLHLGKGGDDQWRVYDEMWRHTGKVKLPMRVAFDHENTVKILELVVNANCLEEQERDDSRSRRDNMRTTRLMDDTIGQISYYGDAIDPRDHDNYTFMVTVMPAVDAHMFWKVTAVLYRVQKEKWTNPFNQGPPAAPTDHERLIYVPRPIKPKPPVHVEMKPTQVVYNHYSKKAGDPISRERRMEQILGLYSYFVSKEDFMKELQNRTGVDYLDKFSSAIEVGRSAMPHQKSMRKELQVNADLLGPITQNTVLERAFDELGERKAWKRLVKISEGIKGFRCTSSNR